MRILLENCLPGDLKSTYRGLRGRTRQVIHHATRLATPTASRVTSSNTIQGLSLICTGRCLKNINDGQLILSGPSKMREVMGSDTPSVALPCSAPRIGTDPVERV